MNLTVMRLVTILVCVGGSLIFWYVYGSFVIGIGVFGSLISIAGLVITLDVLASVRQIQRRYVRQAMLKVAVDKLTAWRRNLAIAIRDRDSSSVRRILSQVRGILSRLISHFKKDLPLEESIKTIVTILAVDNRSLVSRAREAHADLESTTEELALVLIEHEWGDHNG